jgi:hypothetical protein
MIRVEQEHRYGCQVAVLAMIMGITYKEALVYYKMDPDECLGFSSQSLDTILADNGYAIARKYRYTLNNKQRESWPVEPFADLHWCQVQTGVGAHAVIMLADGLVLDPWSAERTSLKHPDYQNIHFVTGVYKV